MEKYHILKILFISTILISFLGLSSSYLNSNDFQKLENSRITTKNSYSLQDSLILYQINSSSDWELIPGIIGSGTKNDPYIIKDIIHYDNISFLYARNSEAFVVFENCYFILSGYYDTDLIFDECTNIEINNCIFYSRSNILSFSNSSQFKITNSNFSTWHKQINLHNCSNFEISTNRFRDSGDNGILLDNCMDSCIYSNYIKGISYGASSGVLITGNSQNITVRDNEIQYCWKAGIIIDLATNITISNNTILNSSSYRNKAGIAQFGAKNCVIDENHIYNMDNDGILLQGCENITVYRNILNNNSQNGISIINSSIINIHQNTIVNNSNYGVFSNLSTQLNLEGNFINNNQNGDIKIIKIPFYQQNWFVIPCTIILVGIEFFILVKKKNEQRNTQTDRVNKKEFDKELSKVIEVKTNYMRDLTHSRN